MRLAVIGTGAIGATLAARWLRAGHDVVLGTRSPGAGGEEVPRRATAEALADAEAVLLAVPAAVLPELLDEHGAALDGLLLLDATNNLSGPPTDLGNARGRLHQLEAFAHAVPRARVYRAFCSVGWEAFADPQFDGSAVDLPYAGPAGEADRRRVEQLIADVGLRPWWLGEGEAAADVLDGVARLWFALALVQGHGRRLAFRVVQ